MGGRFRNIALAVAATALTLTACASPPPPPPPPAQVSGLPTDGPMCIVGLINNDVAFNRIADTARDGGCGISTAVSLYETPTIPLSRPAAMNCGLAQALLAYDSHVIQPLAQRIVGSPVVKIHHAGTYACRGRSSNRSRLSEHAYGRAIDIIAFEFADGRMARVKSNWRDRGPLGDFLRQVSKGACGVFQVVLSPNADADHADHLHLDIGPWKLCQG